MSTSRSTGPCGTHQVPQLSAEATNNAQRERANAIAAKVEGFDFRLPADRAELLGWTNTELTTEQKS